MKIAAVILLAVMLSACGLNRGKQYIGPNGRSAYYVECLDRPENCYPEAQQRCPTGFGITRLDSGLTISFRGETKLADKYVMLIECKE
ncbi:MAG: hypothetical protein FDZ69_01670 [Deltaproteobacteria bacterium]|nr:MAG: hypothetical protein FDZ69_01670 [Deltaproteobacteria bacterium]